MSKIAIGDTSHADTRCGRRCQARPPGRSDGMARGVAHLLPTHQARFGVGSTRTDSIEARARQGLDTASTRARRGETRCITPAKNAKALYAEAGPPVPPLSSGSRYAPRWPPPEHRELASGGKVEGQGARGRRRPRRNLDEAGGAHAGRRRRAAGGGGALGRGGASDVRMRMAAVDSELPCKPGRLAWDRPRP